MKGGKKTRKKRGARHLVNVNQRFPEDTMPRLRPGVNKQLPYVGGPVGGKKTRKSRRKRKMKGGSLVSTDLVTGVSTSETNDVLAFGTSGGSVYMLDKLTGEPINSGPYMNPITEPQPPMA